MDPKATLAIINDKNEDLETREEAMDNLIDWLHKGGAMPCGGKGEEMHPTLSDETMETFSMKREWLFEKAQALRAALCYGDISGLEFFLSSCN